MSLRKLSDIASVSFLVGASVYVGFTLTQLMLTGLIHYMKP